MSISMRAGLLALALTTAATGTAFAQAGLLSGRTELAPLTLASGKPLAKEPYNLTAGKYYRIAIEADGSAELGVVGPSSSATSGSTRS